MDLGIRGRNALVAAASRGMGRACALALAREGVNLTLIARRADVLEATAAEIRAETGVRVTPVVADVAREDGQRTAVAACPDPDILVTNAGGPPHGDFRDFRRDDWIAAFDLNALSAIALIKGTVDGMIARRFGRIVNITSRTVRMPVEGLWLSAAARLALTGFAAALARQVARHNVTVNNLLPGAIDTDRFAENTRNWIAKTGGTADAYRAKHAAATPAARIGEAMEMGAACAYLCSAQAGYITGQNLLIDGGGFPGTL